MPTTPSSIGLRTPQGHDLIRHGAVDITTNAQILADLWKDVVDRIGSLETRNGTAVAGSVATYADLPTDATDGQTWIVRDEVALYTWSQALNDWSDPVPVQASATDAAVAAAIPSDPVTAALALVMAEFIAAVGVERPLASHGVSYVAADGNDTKDGLTWRSAKSSIQAGIDALDGPGAVYLGPGTHTVAATILVPERVALIGAGLGVTTINYTGTGTAISTPTPGVRTYRQELQRFILTGPGKSAAGSVGIDMDSMSTCVLDTVQVQGFHTCIKEWSSLSGGSTYNRFTNTSVRDAVIGYHVAELGSNASLFLACRANVCDYGWHIEGSNETDLLSCQIENNGIGFHVTAPTPASADHNHLISCRFEKNTQDWVIGGDVRDTLIWSPQTFGAGSAASTDAGDRTTIWNWSTGLNKTASASVDPAGCWLFERTVNGGDKRPAVRFRDSSSSSGTPVTVQIETERPLGMFLRALQGGAEHFAVTAQGVVIARASSTRPTAAQMAGQRAGGVMFDTALGRPIWWNGSAWVDATGTTV